MLIELIKSIILGVVEGITEWLPVSSTGHLILFKDLMGFDVSSEFWDMFMVVIQLGAILAVCVMYFHRLNPLSPRKSASEKRATWNLWGKVIVAVIPAAVVGLLINDWMEAHLQTSQVVASMLVLYGIIFILLEHHNRKLERAAAPGAHSAEAAQPPKGVIDRHHNSIATCEDMSYKTALGIGLFQLLSIIPGTSRSGATILGGVVLGCKREAAAEFSFFLAIPVMVGASLLRIVQYIHGGNVLSTDEAIIFAVAIVVSFVVSILAIRFLLRYVQTNDFAAFGWYRIIVGVAILAYFGIFAL